MKNSCLIHSGPLSSEKPMHGSTVYCASKAALDAAVRCMARELGDRPGSREACVRRANRPGLSNWLHYRDQ
jgi:enoyl-[acyl-carrier-protein] reductase (NADH)